MRTPARTIRLSMYERSILDALVSRHGYEHSFARSLVSDYIDVLRKIGGYEQSGHYADLIHRAYSEGCSPERWLGIIADVEQGEARDRGIREELQHDLQSK
ncbi:hypothetical protein [Paenibacillus oryzae]|jgi:hypothetical protein|nr:hypothetical protein [Paenibacillus oryzae]